jgi:hypothetical protein
MNTERLARTKKDSDRPRSLCVRPIWQAQRLGNGGLQSAIGDYCATDGVRHGGRRYNGKIYCKLKGARNTSGCADVV